jgi:hypothetical protein
MDTMNINKKELLERLQQLQRQQEGLSAEIQDLSGMIQNLPEKVPEQDYLSFKDGEKCWYVEMDGTISSVLYSEKNMKFETIRHRIFKSEHTAKLFAEKTQFLADCLYWKELYDKDYVPDWDDTSKTKYPVIYDYCNKMYTVAQQQLTRCDSEIYFSSEHIAQGLADWLNRKREEMKKCEF